MKKEFSQTADSVTQRVMNVIIGITNFLGDGLELASSGVTSGLWKAVAEGSADWNLLKQTYLDRPLPLVVTCISMTGSAYIARQRFEKGFAFYLGATIVMAGDMAWNGEVNSALSVLPFIAGNGVMVINKWLDRYMFGKSKTLGGALHTYASWELISAGRADQNIVTTICAYHWFIASFTGMLLPFFGPKKQTRTKVQVVSPYTRQTRHLPKKFRKKNAKSKTQRPSRKTNGPSNKTTAKPNL